MTNLHPDLGETRRQELRNSPFLSSPLFHSQLVQEGEEFLLKKGSSKSQGQTFRPYQNPFRGHQRVRGRYRKCPYGQSTPGSSTSSNRVVSVAEAALASADPIAGVEVQETPQNNDSHRDPQVGGCLMQVQESLGRRKMFKLHLKNYYETNQTSSDHIRIQKSAQRPGPSLLYTLSPEQTCNRKKSETQSLLVFTVVCF